MEKDQLGCLFTKMFYGDFIYFPTPKSSMPNFEFPSTVAPNLLEAPKGQVREKKKKV
jgi:hypothetical protein